METHILRDCEAEFYLRFRRLGHYRINDYLDAPLIKVANLLRRA
jgi:hypothetical protein